MTFSLTKALNTIQLLIMVFLLSSFLVFDSYAWGKYTFIISAALILLISVIKNNGKLKFCFEPFIAMLLLFTAYVALTSFWSLSGFETLTKARTLLRIVVCGTMIYWSFLNDEDPYRLVLAFIFASYFTAIYSIYSYGFSNIIHVANSIYFSESFTNINSIALFLAFGCICDLYMMLFCRFRIYSLLSILSVAVIAATSSRKAIIFLFVGTLLLLLFRYAASESIGYRILKGFSILAFTAVAVYLLIQLPIFSHVNIRLEQMLNTFKGTGKMDTSSLMRNKLVELGISCWLKNPIGGIGIGATAIVAREELNFGSYLHNNFVELLAGGGIIAFLLYYAMYAHLIHGFFKLRKSDYQWFVFGIVFIILMLITDYGRVSYYSKTVTFELMLLFLTLRNVAYNRKEEPDDLQSD